MPADTTDAGGGGGHAVGDLFPGEQTGLDHGLVDHSESRLQPDHAHRGGGPFGLLGLDRVGGVVGGHDVDGAVGQSLAQRLDVLGGAQRRVDLVDRVVALGQVVGEDQVVGGDLRGDVAAAFLGPPDDVDRALGGDVAHVQTRADVLGEQAVAGDDRLLGDRGPAGQAESVRDAALVHLGALGQARFLGVLGDDAVEGLDVLQRAAHEQRVGDADAVVGEDPDTGGGVGHGADLGEPFAGQADGDRADRAHVAVSGLLAQAPDLLDHAGGVGDGVGVGHGVHGGVAAHRGGAGAGGDGLGVLTAGFAQVGVQVDQAGKGDQTGGVHDLCPVGGRQVGTDRGDLAVLEQQVDRVVTERACAADQVGSLVFGHGDVGFLVFVEVRGRREGPANPRWRVRAPVSPRNRRGAGRARPCAG